MPTKLMPLGNKVIVRRDVPKKETPGGIIIPQRTLDKEIPHQGVIVSVGPEVGVKSLKARGDALGELKKSAPADQWAAIEVSFPPVMIVKTGDRVLFNAFSGSDIEIGEGNGREKFTVMLEDDILAVLVATLDKPEKDPFSAAAEGVRPRRK